MLNGYTIRWFKKEDLTHYIMGLNEALYDRYNEKRFNWKFESNPHKIGFIPISVVVENESDKIVGFNSFLPLEMRIGNRFHQIVQGCDGFIQKEYRRRGLFLETIKFMVKEFKQSGPDLLMGFNFSGSTAAAIKAGANAVCEIDFWKIDPQQINSFDNQSILLNEIAIDEVYSIYSEWAKNSSKPHIHRSLQYLRWRFLDSPLRDYRFFKLIHRKKELGYLILSIVENEENKIVVGVDDYILHKSNQDAILEAITNITQIVDVTATIEIITKKGGILDTSLRRLRITPEIRYTMILKPISKDTIHRDQIKVSELNQKDWHISASDIY